MLAWSALLLAAAALLGCGLAIMHAGLPGVRRPHWTLAALHGALGIAGLGVLLARLAGPAGTPTLAQLGPVGAALLGLAVLLGGVPIVARLRRRPVPGLVIGLHATIALLGGVIVAACLAV